jgi:hypothetical protein
MTFHVVLEAVANYLSESRAVRRKGEFLMANDDALIEDVRLELEQVAQDRFAPVAEKHGLTELPRRKTSWETHLYYLLSPDRAVDVWLDFREEGVYVTLVKVSNGKPVEDSYRSSQQTWIGVLHFLEDVLHIHDTWLEGVDEATDRWALAPRLTFGIATESLTIEAEMVDRYFDILVQQPEEVLFPMKWKPGPIK